MKICHASLVVLTFALFAGGGAAFASAQEDKEMLALAKSSGCSLCHDMESRKRGPQELLPYGPAWKDVGRRYKGDAGAVETLTATVMQGSGGSAAKRHWQYKTQVAEMPSNAVVLTEDEARKMVRWMLSLGK